MNQEQLNQWLFGVLMMTATGFLLVIGFLFFIPAIVEQYKKISKAIRKF